MNTKIGVLDSGIGGVTVLKECMKIVPQFEYLYYSDSIHNPYGDQSQEVVIGYCDKIVRQLIDRGCYIIIIACNTASAMAVDYLRKYYQNIYFIAIEPAIKLAYDMSCDGTLIMATKGTMDSERFHLLYDKYHHDNFYLLSCVGLANLIESGNKDSIINYLESHLSQYKGKVSNVVLGCTHYPLIKREISKVLGDVTFYDGAVGVSKQLKRIVDENHFVSRGIGKVIFEDSTGSVEKKERFWKFLEEDYE